MTRRERDFVARSPLERQWMTENTWCEHCQKADLGLSDPVEYESDGKFFIEGECRVCGSCVVSEIQEHTVK
jgi:hypothetical protein